MAARCIALFWTVLLVNCSGDDTDPSGGVDSTDAGADVTDAGADVTDAGADVSDAGADVTDAGADVTDAAADATDATADATPPGPCPVTLVEGKSTAVPTTGKPRPALNTPYDDEHYGLKVARVTAASQVTDHDFPSWVRHEYSRRPAFNSDSTRALMVSSNGWLRHYEVKADGTLAFLETLDLGASTEPNWHPSDPHKLWHLGKSGAGFKITAYDTASGQTTTYRDLQTKVKALFPTATTMWTRGEGRPSDDGKIWCLMVENGTQTVGLIAYDAVNDKILGSLATTVRPDHISTSPKGNYCVPSWGAGMGTRAYKTDFSTYTQLHGTSAHSDLALTAASEEVYVYSDSSADATWGGKVVMTKLSDGAKVALFSKYGPNGSATGLHISGTAKNRPGYVVVSTYHCTEKNGAIACNPSTQWFYDKVFAVKLAANPKIYNLAHTHFGDAGYWAQAHAVVNPDFTKVLFASTWESTATKDVASYLIQVPSCALD